MKNLGNVQDTGKKFIQFFGYIIICNLNGDIVGISNNFSELLGVSANLYLAKNIGILAERYFSSIKTEIISGINSIVQSQIQRQTMQHSIGNSRFCLNILQYNEKIYLEWEEQRSTSITLSHMNALGHLLEEKATHIWESLCSAIQDITKYDRVLLYQINESGVGKTLTETTTLNQPCFLGEQFSEDFMPARIKNYYQSSAFRYCPNISRQTVELSYIDDSIDISVSQFVPLPDLHLQCLRSLCVRSVIIFPILINGNFWGMLIGHNYEEKAIDLQKRQFCAFLVQFAANRYESQTKQELLTYHDQIKDIELDLKRKLMQNKSINCTLVQNLETLCQVPKANGVAIFHNGDIFTYGLCPTESQISQIKQTVDSLDKKPVFKDHNFRLKYGQKIDGHLPFAGLLALQIANRKDHYIFWFRKENINQVFQINPIIESSYESRNSRPYKTWKKTIVNSSIPWNKNNLYFVESLHKLIQETIILKSQEQERFNEQLVALNNELETLTFTLSHDLKNPLAIVKIGIQMLQRSKHINDEDKLKWTSTILAGVQNIESIIDGLSKLGKSKSYQLSKDPVPMAHMLRKIAQDAKILYNIDNCELKFGKMLPVWGEKSLVFQIFLNVIGNAIKYSSMKENPLVEINSYLSDNNIYYEIKDNGIGIPLESLPYIFNVFVRANNTENFSGSGIGLCLVKRIIEKLGGKIKIESQLNYGTVITLIFPCLGEIHPSIFTGEFQMD